MYSLKFQHTSCFIKNKHAVKITNISKETTGFRLFLSHILTCMVLDSIHVIHTFLNDDNNYVFQIIFFLFAPGVNEHTLVVTDCNEASISPPLFFFVDPFYFKEPGGAADVGWQILEMQCLTNCYPHTERRRNQIRTG